MRNFVRSCWPEHFALRVFFLDGAERGRRGEHRGAVMFGDHPPEGAGVGRADRLALVEDRGAAVKQRRVDDVRMADHPADVGRRPVHLARLDAVEILHRPLQRDHVAAVVAHHALGPAGGARRVENVERIGRRDRHAVVGRAGVNERVVAHRRPVVVAALDQCRPRLRPLQDQARGRLVRGELNRLVEQRLVMRRRGRARARSSPTGSPSAWRRQSGSPIRAPRSRRTPPNEWRRCARRPAWR